MKVEHFKRNSRGLYRYKKRFLTPQSSLLLICDLQIPKTLDRNFDERRFCRTIGEGKYCSSKVPKISTSLLLIRNLQILKTLYQNFELPKIFNSLLPICNLQILKTLVENFAERRFRPITDVFSSPVTDLSQIHPPKCYPQSRVGSAIFFVLYPPGLTSFRGRY